MIVAILSFVIAVVAFLIVGFVGTLIAEKLQ